MIFFFLPLLLLLVCLFTAYMYQKIEHFSGWAGAFALALLLIPIVVRTTDNMLLLVPNNLREAAAALGCSQWQVIMMICYRAAKSGILTGVLLAVARISGENCTAIIYRSV
ncbi:ABC transporter permease subunit [Haemophilus influenzae]